MGCAIDSKHKVHSLKALDMGINTYQEPVVYMREDCDVCRAEGFSASSRIRLSLRDREMIATLNIVAKHVLPQGHAGLSKIAMEHLRPEPGEEVFIGHAPMVESLASIRKKVFGNPLSREELQAIIADVTAYRYADIEIASFLSVCAGNGLNVEEIIGLTQAMVNAGKKLSWPGHERIFDKHCIGGLPGNRTSPLVVSIVSAAGHIIPKTSSRAITSPAGTADTMKSLTNVNLKLEDIQRVVRETGACLTWGGAVNLSPADDLLIRIERALDLDTEGQLIASVLSKKIAAGSTDVVIDIPVGRTAKVRSNVDADRLIALFNRVSQACGIRVRCVTTDGSKPVGYGIGPVEEARDLLAILQCREDAPRDLIDHALLLASHLLDMAENCGLEKGWDKAKEILDSGRAYRQFLRIAEAQGGLKPLQEARHRHIQPADGSGVITAIDNRKLARLAKLAGAPLNPSAGLRLHANVGDWVTAGEPLFTLYTDSLGERNYALDYYDNHDGIFTIVEPK